MEIKNAEFVMSNTDVAKCPNDHLPEFAFIGRSNVGKSSLINMLVNRKQLAMTSQRPGKTQLINHFLINKQWYIVDLPGYGYAKISNTLRQSIQTIIQHYLCEREEMTNLFVLIDCRHAPLKIDMEFMEWLGENEIPFSIVFTKTDKIGKMQLLNNLNAYKQKLSEIWEELPPMFCTSATNGDGKQQLLDYIESILKGDDSKV